MTAAESAAYAVLAFREAGEGVEEGFGEGSEVSDLYLDAMFEIGRR